MKKENVLFIVTYSRSVFRRPKIKIEKNRIFDLFPDLPIFGKFPSHEKLKIKVSIALKSSKHEAEKFKRIFFLEIMCVVSHAI